MKTQAEADAVIAATELPAGWSLKARPVRTFKWRSLWALYLYHGDLVDSSWSMYDLRAGVRMAAGHARRAAGVAVSA